MLIGEVAAKSGVSARMLRHYDTIGLVSPSARTAGGYRRYSETDVWRLFHVESLRSLGLGLDDVAAVLNSVAADPTLVVAELIERTRERIDREQDLLRRLEQVQTASPGAWSDVLHTTRLIRGLDADDPSTRQRLALSLGFKPAQDVDTLVEAVLSERDTNASGALAWALARFGDAAMPGLADGLHSSSADRRRRAVEALTKLDTPSARSTLSTALEHPDRFVSRRAALVLGRLGERGAVPPLLDMVVSGQEDVDAAELLAGLASRHDCGDEIVTAIQDAYPTADPAARVRLTETLGEIPGTHSTAALTDLADDPNRQVAVTALALLRLRATVGQRALRRTAVHPDASQRGR